MEKVNGLIFLEKTPPEAKDSPCFTVYYFTAGAQEAQVRASMSKGYVQGFQMMLQSLVIITELV